MLESGQIRFLYVWVHPQYHFRGKSRGDVDGEIGKYRQFANRVSHSERSALIRTTPCRIAEPQHDAYRIFMEEFGRLDEAMKKQLGERYVVWNSPFINLYADGCEDMRKLVNKFRLVEDDQHEFLTPAERVIAESMIGRDKRLVAKTHVFGKVVGWCPMNQAYSKGLHKASSVVMYHPQEIPKDIMPPTEEMPFPPSGMGAYVLTV